MYKLKEQKGFKGLKNFLWISIFELWIKFMDMLCITLVSVCLDEYKESSF